MATKNLFYLFGLLVFLPWCTPAQENRPIRGFLSVEPHELRLEALVELDGFRTRLGLDGDSVDHSRQKAVLQDLGEQLEQNVKLTVPAKDITFSDRMVRFVVFDSAKGFIDDVREQIPIKDALVGITLSASASGVTEVEIDWRWFAPGQKTLAVEVASSGRPYARFVSPTESVLSWQMEESAGVSQLIPVPVVEKEPRRRLRLLLIPGVILTAFGVVLLILKRDQAPSWVGWLVIGGLACGVASFKWRMESVVTPKGGEMNEIVYALLKNVYHAFDFRDESDIYDSLEPSISGELLEKVYLEIRESLELENSGGPRVRVYEVALRDCRIEDVVNEAGVMQARADWVTIGEVTHWGHTHERTNRYDARVTLTAEQGQWKFRELELLSEEREQKVSRRAVAPE